jgi:hypothetical protein
MKDLKAANKCIKRLIKSQAGLEDGIAFIIDDLRRVFHFSDVARFNRTTISNAYKQFEEWLNNLIVSETMPLGIVALYFGLRKNDEDLQLYVSGSRQWDLKNQSWADRKDWFPEGRCAELPIYTDVSKILSSHSFVGYYLAIALLAIMIREYTQSSVISLLDDERQALCIACGFEGGSLHAIGDLYDDGLEPPVYSRLGRLLG